MSRLGFFVLLLTLVTAAAGAHAATFLVNTAADSTDPSPGDGVCGAMSLCSLRQAVQETNALPGADTVLLPAGTYTLTFPGTGEDLAATGDLDVLDDLEIAGEGATETIVDADGLDRVLHVPSWAPGQPQVTLRAVTITGGSAVTADTIQGGGIFAEWATLLISHCTISGNAANRGGGAMLAYADTEIYYSTLSGNSSLDLGFQPERGAAVHSYYSGLVLWGSTVSGNTAQTYTSQAIYLEESESVLIANSTIVSNDTPAGIRAFANDSSADVTTLFHVTVAGNSGRGIGFNVASSDEFVMKSSIVADNTQGDCQIGGGVYTHVSNLDSDGSCGLDAGAGELPSTAPDLGPLQWNGGPTMTRAPNAASPVIDAAADPQVCLAVDQRGVPRPEDGGGSHLALCDIGAVEVAPLIFVDTFESADAYYWSKVVN